MKKLWHLAHTAVFLRAVFLGCLALLSSCTRVAFEVPLEDGRVLRGSYTYWRQNKDQSFVFDSTEGSVVFSSKSQIETEVNAEVLKLLNLLAGVAK